MILSARYTEAQPSQAVLVVMQDGTKWSFDAQDQGEMARQLSDWVAMGGQIDAYIEPEPAPEIAPVDLSILTEMANALKSSGALSATASKRLMDYIEAQGAGE